MSTDLISILEEYTTSQPLLKDNPEYGRIYKFSDDDSGAAITSHGLELLKKYPDMLVEFIICPLERFEKDTLESEGWNGIISKCSVEEKSLALKEMRKGSKENGISQLTKLAELDIDMQQFENLCVPTLYMATNNAILMQYINGKNWHDILEEDPERGYSVNGMIGYDGLMYIMTKLGKENKNNAENFVVDFELGKVYVIDQ